jgi:uncharacterized membrane protein YeaQ/YmgE (transglycosylase-associated protein family)
MPGLIWFLLIGLVAGWLASIAMKSRGGLLWDLGISAGGLIGSLIMAFVGAVILILILRAVRRA